MALNGIGGGDAGSALERFQRIRDSAKKKLEVEDRQSDLAGLVKRKQAELGVGNGASGLGNGTSVRPAAERSTPAAVSASANMAPAAGAGAAGAASASAYGRAGGLEKPDPKPRLGRFVDFMA